MDNKQLKDGIGDLFSLRQRDRSTGGDGTLMQTMVLSTGYPLDYGTGVSRSHALRQERRDGRGSRRHCADLFISIGRRC